jgi:YHS domain-containing protein
MEGTMNRRRAVLTLIAACFSASALAQSTPGKAFRLAIKGYDPVAYFVEGRPVMGAASIAYDFDDARYLFSSAKNRELFVSNPERYTPQFAGLCTTGLSLGRRVEADPNMFIVRDGKLYVFMNANGREMAEKDPAIFAKARQAWSSN